MTEDSKLLKRLPKGKWFAAGAYGVHGMTMRRLERLGYAEKRPAPVQLGVSRCWDWRMKDVRKTDSSGWLDELVLELQKLQRYDLDQCGYYGDPCMEPYPDGDYLYVDSVLRVVKNFVPSNAEDHPNAK